MKLGGSLTKWALIGLACSLSLTASSAEPQLLQIGRFHSRAIWTPVDASSKNTPTIILVPGSGPSGPREIIPGEDTVDGKDSANFDRIAAAMHRAGAQTLQLGKPGVEDQSAFDIKTLFYDPALYHGLHWKDLLANLDDAITFLNSQPCVNSEKIFILGHSQGTQVAVDYARDNPSKVAGVILLGYSGEDISTVLDWQLFRRMIDKFIEPDVDTNHDGIVTREEAAKWPNEFNWDWNSAPNGVKLSEIEASLRSDPRIEALWSQAKSTPLTADGIWNRGPIYKETASLTQPVYVFTGSLDEQTPPEDALKLKDTCAEVHKTNCVITIVPGVGHGFSPPRPPRVHPYLDMTVGPPGNDILDRLTGLVKNL